MSVRSRFITAVLSAGVLATTLMAAAAQHEAAALRGEWSVTQMAGTAVANDAGVTIRFDDAGGVSGRGACNRYTGGYEVAPDRLTIGPLAMTRMACTGDRMAIEAAFSEAIGNVAHGTVDDAGVLTLSDAEGRALILAEPAAD